MQVAADVVGIHATDPASVYLGAFARTHYLTHEVLAHALYEERSLLKILGMRRTMFVVPRDLVPIIHAAVTTSLVAAERKRLVAMLRAAGVATDVETWIADVEAETVAALDGMGEATASELTRRVEGLRVQISFGEGKKWAGKVGVSTRMLFLLATEGRIVRGRPRGSWLSSLYAWAPMDRWLGVPLEVMPLAEAQAELVRRYLSAYGPVTFRDVQWWTGWTVASSRRALEAVGAVEVNLDDGKAYALADDLGPTAPPGPWIALLPALDTTVMGWAERGFFLANHASHLFDRSGNAGPSLWVDGRIVGGWAQRKNGEVIYRLLEDVGRERERDIGAEAARIQAWLGNARVIPRFRTPLERELSQ